MISLYQQIDRRQFARRYGARASANLFDDLLYRVVFDLRPEWKRMRSIDVRPVTEWLRAYVQQDEGRMLSCDAWLMSPDSDSAYIALSCERDAVAFRLRWC